MMNRENRILILSGVGLLALTMFFGFWYAIFDEHQTLNAMGFALATGFMEAAGSNLNGAYEALDQYGALSREYRQEIHFHGHFAFLGLTAILFGLVAHTLAYGERTRVRLASFLAVSAFLFPFGVFLQIGSLQGLGKIVAVLGTIGLVVSILFIVVGIMRSEETTG
ncbi:MAG: hypothetical protein OEU36_22930 [Gammaproteobacteria bacterium]|nr:hypothetical protein [Gammaproteobacteria bacterium]